MAEPLDYQPVSPHPPAGNVFSGIPGIVGFGFVCLQWNLHLAGPKVMLGILFAAILFAGLNLTLLRIKESHERKVLVFIDMLWLGVTLLPPGCCGMFLAVLNAAEVNYLKQ